MVKLYNKNGELIEIKISGNQLRGLYEILQGGKTPQDREQIETLKTWVLGRNAGGISLGGGKGGGSEFTDYAGRPKTIKVSGRDIEWNKEFDDAYVKLGLDSIDEGNRERNIHVLQKEIPQIAKQIEKQQKVEVLQKHLKAISNNVNKYCKLQLGQSKFSPSHEFNKEIHNIQKALNDPAANTDKIQERTEQAFGKYIGDLKTWVPPTSYAENYKKELESMKVAVGKAVIEIEQFPKKEHWFLSGLKSIGFTIANAISGGYLQKKRSMLFSNLEEARGAAVSAASQEGKNVEISDLIRIFNRNPEEAIKLVHWEKPREKQIAQFLVKNQKELDNNKVLDYVNSDGNERVLNQYLSLLADEHQKGHKFRK